MLEHGDDTLARCATTGREDDGDDASMDARSRVCSAWGHLTRERGDGDGESAREKRGGLRERERDVGDARGETETERTGLGVDRRRIARGRVSGGA